MCSTPSNTRVMTPAPEALSATRVDPLIVDGGRPTLAPSTLPACVEWSCRGLEHLVLVVWRRRTPSMTDHTRQRIFDDLDDLQRTADELHVHVQSHLAADEPRVHWHNAQEGLREPFSVRPMHMVARPHSTR